MYDSIYSVLIYTGAGILCIIVLYVYIRKLQRESDLTRAKIIKAREEGLYEPVSLHPVVDVNSCIKTGACIIACPEKDILGIVNGKAAVINASRCIGHGACFKACPTKAISLHLGTEQRGINLPHVNENFETNVKGIYIAGEIGGMGLIKNAVKQGEEAVENIRASMDKSKGAQYDLVIVGAGPAGISAALTAKKNMLNFLIVDQDSLGGTVFTFPRQKIVMTSPMTLPLYGAVKFQQTSKRDLLNLWNEVLHRNNISVRENTKVQSIGEANGNFKINLSDGTEITSSRVLLAIGRRGSPRKLNVPGEELEKVAYRLLEPEQIAQKEIIVAGGGDSAVEAALALAENNHVLLSYRGETFSRIKPVNAVKIEEAMKRNLLRVIFNSNIVEISPSTIKLSLKDPDQIIEIPNDLVYIFAGGELPSQFLEKAGIKIRTYHGEAILKHKK